MIERRLFLPPSTSLDAFAADKEVPLEAQEASYARTVLRLPDGAAVVALDGSGRFLPATLRHEGRTEARLLAYDAPIGESARARPTTLVVPAAKGERTDWLLEKATEMGVARVVLAHCQRSQGRGKGPARWGRWQRLCRAAARQARHGRCPTLLAAASLAEALQQAPGVPGGRFVAHPEAGAPPLATLLLRASEAVVVLGPEGGLTEDELQHLAAHGYTLAALGPHILRVETAALAAMAACLLVPTNHSGPEGA